MLGWSGPGAVWPWCCVALVLCRAAPEAPAETGLPPGSTVILLEGIDQVISPSA